MKSAEYIHRLHFSYITTYSFNRGPKLIRLQGAFGSMITALRGQLLTSSGAELEMLRQRLRSCEQAQRCCSAETLTQEHNQAFNPTASPIARLPRTDAAELTAMLQRPVVTQYDWMCAPVYRDALVFQGSDHQIISVLNICFGCDRMLTDTNVEIEADCTVYQDMKQLLLRLGHDIWDTAAAPRQ